MLGPLPRPASWIARNVPAALVAVALALGPASPVAAGDPPTTTDPGLAAAGWLAAQIETDPTLGPGNYADAIFAFAAVGAGQAAAATALAGMEAGLEGYAFPGGVTSPGAVAKVMLAVQVQGADPNDFGGRDLEAELRALLISGGADDGRFGTASILDQSIAILALSRTTGDVPAASVTWLASAQCPSGEYTWDGTCPAAPGSDDPDTTALAVQALLAEGETTSSAAAVTWLLSIQEAGGGLPSFGLANTNSSGVGGQALRAAGETAAADAAAAFVVSLSFGCDAAAADIGAIGWAVGIPGFPIFSTPQAVLALGAPPLYELSAEGAMADAPVLECATGPAPTSTPTPAPSAAPATPAPSGDQLPDTSVPRAAEAGDLAVTGPIVAFLVALVAAGAIRGRRTTG